jgi:hypothetical protein
MPKTVQLSSPLAGPNGVKITSITLRDPNFGDFVDLGFPVTYVAVRGGGGFEQETPSVIRDWIERLYDGDPNFLAFLNLRDTLALRDAVVDFFREARAPLAPATE